VLHVLNLEALAVEPGIGYALIVAGDWLWDRPETMVNVAGDSFAAAIVERLAASRARTGASGGATELVAARQRAEQAARDGGQQCSNGGTHQHAPSSSSTRDVELSAAEDRSGSPGECYSGKRWEVATPGTGLAGPSSWQS
jgi:hypothetical protein